MRYNHSAVSFVSILIITLSIFLIMVLNRSNPQPAVSDSDTSRPDQSVRVVLLNGCGRAGLATQFAKILRSRGYDVMNGQGGNADSFDFDVSVVVDRKGNRALAQQVADDLGIDTVIDQYGADAYVLEDCEIIIGKDWDTLSMAKEVHTE